MSQKIKQGLCGGGVVQRLNRAVYRLTARLAQNRASIVKNFASKSSLLGGSVGSHSGSN